MPDDETGSDKRSQDPLTREQLYELVWKEPMLRIGERLGVSSSYLARVCTDLRVPRPARGYWAQREFGKIQPQRPSLPLARPGDLTAWRPGQALASPRPVVPRRAASKLSTPSSGQHELLIGVKPHFLKSRKSEVGLLRPFKRLLVDIVTSEKQLDLVLSAVSDLFLALEAKGHRVTLAPTGTGMRRAPFEESEVPSRNHFQHGRWSPDRLTVVYIGDVPIGLTIFEMTEEIEVMYVRGTYIPVRELSPTQLRQYQGPMHWKTKQSRVSGRFCVQAYCPHHRVAWTKQWRIESAKEISSFAPRILQELLKTAPVLTNQIAEAEAHALVQRREWEDERRRQLEEYERAQQAKARQEAENDLLAAIDAWDRTRRVQEWFAVVEREAMDLPEADRQEILGRLEQAKALISGGDALDLLKVWKTPGERR